MYIVFYKITTVWKVVISQWRTWLCTLQGLNSLHGVERPAACAAATALPAGREGFGILRLRYGASLPGSSYAKTSYFPQAGWPFQFVRAEVLEAAERFAAADRCGVLSWVCAAQWSVGRPCALTRSPRSGRVGHGLCPCPCSCWFGACGICRCGLDASGGYFGRGGARTDAGKAHPPFGEGHAEAEAASASSGEGSAASSACA